MDILENERAMASLEEEWTIGSLRSGPGQTELKLLRKATILAFFLSSVKFIFT